MRYGDQFGYPEWFQRGEPGPPPGRRRRVEFDRTPILPHDHDASLLVDGLMRFAEREVTRQMSERLDQSWRFRQLLQGCE